MARPRMALKLKDLLCGQRADTVVPTILCKWKWKAGEVIKYEQEGWSSEKTTKSQLVHSSREKKLVETACFPSILTYSSSVIEPLSF